MTTHISPTKTVSPAEFMDFIVNKTGSLDESRPKELFGQLFPSRDRVTVEEVQGIICYDVSVKLAESLAECVEVYAGTDGCIGADEFMAMHIDLYESSPSSYDAMCKKLF